MGRHRARRPGGRAQPQPAAGRLTTQVALLRGVNLGSRNRIAMADLRRLLGQAGAANVETYVHSGNAVFESAAKPAELESSLAAAIGDELGLSVEVLVRTRAELAKIVRANPFAREEDDPLRLHVTFLAAAPSRERAAALPAGEGRDRLRLAGREVYLHTPGGYGRSKLSNAFLERALGVAATTRNWRTVTALAELAARRGAS